MSDEISLLTSDADVSLITAMVWTYSIVGALFMFYSVAVIVHTAIIKKVRFSLSFFFFLTGLLFFNLTGRALSGYIHQFTLLTIVNSVILAVVGMIVVNFLLQINRLKNRKDETCT